MRASKREAIIDAAVSLIDAQGLDAVTYESLSEATGITKSGIVYHFPSRHELIIAIHQRLADEWEEQLEAAAHGTAEEVDEATRLRAMVTSMSANATRADLIMMLNSALHEDYAQVWHRVDSRWVPPREGVDGPAHSKEARRRYLVQLMADGLWLHDHVHDSSLSPAERKALTEEILAFVAEVSRP